MKRSGLGLLTLLALGLCASLASADIKGRYKIYRVGELPTVEGEVTELPNEYEVEVRPGIRMKIPKTQVKRLEEIKELASGAPASVAGAGAISEADIEAIIGSESIELSALDEEDTIDLMANLPLDQESLNDMLRIAGPKAKHLETKHFVIVYTSDRAKAIDMAARLDKVYEWCCGYAQQLAIPKRMPDYKLEIFFFGTYDEFQAFRTTKGQGGGGVLGQYFPDVHRSLFFDMDTWPSVKEAIERSKDPSIPPEERRRMKNQQERWAEWMNLEVVQHEAAHHVHFSIGIFPRVGEWTRWVVEGLATMFEVPPTEIGGSLGAINHARLAEFRRSYGEKGERVPWQYVRDLIIGRHNGYEVYVMGWALHQYLYRKHPENYAKFMQAMADKEYEWGQGLTERLEVFEDIFGPVDEEWVKKFMEYVASIQFMPSKAGRAAPP